MEELIDRLTQLLRILLLMFATVAIIAWITAVIILAIYGINCAVSTLL